MEKESEAQGAEVGGRGPARPRSSLGWVRGGCEWEVARDDDVQVAAWVEERVRVGGVQDGEVPRARGAVVVMGTRVTESGIEDEGVMPLEVAQRRAYGSWRRSDRHRAFRRARTQYVLRNGSVRWDDASESRTLMIVKGVKAVVLAEPSACSKCRHRRRRHGAGSCLRFEWARPKDRDG